MDNVIQFPALGTYKYNAERLHRYAGSLMREKQWNAFDIVMSASALYDEDLIDIDWDPATGEPIFKLKGGQEEVIDPEALK